MFKIPNITISQCSKVKAHHVMCAFTLELKYSYSNAELCKLRLVNQYASSICKSNVAPCGTRNPPRGDVANLRAF
jgi:hypothetical protein